MRPILFELFGVPFASWYVFFALGGIVSYLYAQRLLNCSGNERAALLFPGIFAACYLSGWLGARALSIWLEQMEVTSVAGFFEALMQIGPMTFYGGAVAAFFVGLLSVLWLRLPLGLMVDAGLPAGIAALGLGRIGCHLNGDDFGRVVPDVLGNPWWSVTFPNLGDGLGRYPVQLQEALFSLILASGAYIVFQKTTRLGKHHSGVLAALVALLSAVNRFVNEFFRGDPRGAFAQSDLSTSQGIALLIGCVSAVYIFFEHKKRRQA